MGLAELPLLLALVGLAAYVVLGGADFGAGVWHMLLPGEHRRRLRDHSYHAMGPVWEANHVWLIFVLVVVWTAYPTVFGAIFSTLYVPLFVAALGIILRGTCYAVRGVVSSPREERILGVLFGVSSALTPFALGATIGGIASGRVPLATPGDAVDSWVNPTSVLIGALAIITSAYLAAVWLTADAARAGQDDIVEPFRRRALGAGAVAGAVAVGGLFVIRSDAERIYEGLTSGAGLVAVLASLVAGSATLLFVVRRRLEAARWSAAVAVAAVVAGWALAQQPQLLPGVTVEEAAAGDTTLVTLLVSLAVGAVILIPSLVLLFGMVVRGRFDERPGELGSLEHAVPAPHTTGDMTTEPGRGVGIAAAVCALLGVPLTLVFDSGAPLALGVVLMLGAVAAASAWLVPKVALERVPLEAAPMEERPE